ncbi:hypothetical protein L0Z31_20950 (plasmid) [Burkholderia vietnamiensis]|uniref:hypothetical protein n=1 Tax=Burkholderia vietnamiensis TaxID=60552 RepID=UPI0020189A9B|nr:hypothetical protein [Burkholderia vietnamiensis]MCO1349932.1 hypothetical protein [Burkholderia vietnamiensis]MCO1432402.1 hypothetical protein [Burkholderia vietnamiensis]UQN47435.1 hypothetical protein L0Y95_03965 [Burkholderia vietnamiensis]
MTTVFIAGSMNIKHLDPKVQERIDKIVDQHFSVVVGDANGVDAAIQSYLQERGATDAVVYCSGASPRNNIGGWTVRQIDVKKFAPGSRAFYTAKDLEMARVADYGLMVWDAKSTGTLSNVIELLRQNKKSLVFVNKAKRFVPVGDAEQLKFLVTFMSPLAYNKADEKIGLAAKISSFKHEQSDLFAH